MKGIRLYDTNTEDKTAFAHIPENFLRNFFILMEYLSNVGNMTVITEDICIFLEYVSKGVTSYMEKEVIKTNEEPEREGFLFLPSYLESYEYFKAIDMELAYLFLEAVIAYGIEQKRITDNPSIMAVMASIERTMNASRKKREQKRQKKAAAEKTEGQP